MLSALYSFDGVFMMVCWPTSTNNSTTNKWYKLLTLETGAVNEERHHQWVVDIQISAWIMRIHCPYPMGTWDGHNLWSIGERRTSVLYCALVVSPRYAMRSSHSKCVGFKSSPPIYYSFVTRHKLHCRACPSKANKAKHPHPHALWRAFKSRATLSFNRLINSVLWPIGSEYFIFN